MFDDLYPQSKPVMTTAWLRPARESHMCSVMLGVFSCKTYFFTPYLEDSNLIPVSEKFDAIEYGQSEMARVHFLTYETLLEDEYDQVLGFTHVADCEGLSANHITKWSPSVFVKIIRQGEQSTPMRHKEIHLFNVPKTVKYVYDFAKSKMSPKISSRMTLHTEMNSLHTAVNAKCLPKEYGGVFSMDEMISEWKKELIFRRSTITRLEKMELLREKPKSINDIDYSLPGSFRKLEVD